MLIRRAYAASVLGALTLALALGVQPAWGATRLSQTGTVGASAISEPGATCKYVFLPASYWIQLRRIVVAPRS